ncbi:MAG TPA: hypothetical protein VF085_07520 [Solirubrobacterales bacterium]
MVSGCGGSSSSSPSEQQLEAAREQGEKAAHESDRIDRLQHQVHHLQHEVHRHGHTVVVEQSADAETADSPSVSSEILRTFHAPSGNVSCEILSNGALCSVDSIGETFAFSDGQEAHTESGAVLPRGTGELAPYGSTVSAGSIACTVPQSSEPRGIVCTDSESGHGFEASRVSERQSVY